MTVTPDRDVRYTRAKFRELDRSKRGYTKNCDANRALSKREREKRLK